MIDIFKEFLSLNPSKILGTIKETTDRYGNPDISIVGELENIEAIDVAPINIPQKSKDVQNIEYSIVSQSTEVENIAKSLKITKEAGSKVEKIQKKSTQKKKAFNLIISGDEEQEIYTDYESFKILNKGIDEDIVSVWAWYNEYLGLPQSKFFENKKPIATEAWFDLQMKNNLICFDPAKKEYVPSSIYYSGNIYDKLVELERNSFLFESKNLTEQSEKQQKALRNILPNPLKLDGEESERLVLSVLSKFVSDFKIDYDGEEKTILEAFKDYLRSLNESDLKYNVRIHHVINYYIEGERFSSSYDKFEKITIKRNSAQECVHQLSKFLSNEISTKERLKIEYAWNRQHNGYVDVDYNRIPLAFQFSKFFKDGDLKVRDAQREGVAFQVANGTGIIAYDVGVGKTLTAILNVANAIQSGQCKRPLIVVPKPTYGKWISEINGIYDEEGNLVGSGILPQYNILDLFNLDEKRRSLLYKDGKLIDIPENTICICTYEGLSRIGFSDEASEEFISELKEILNQGYGDASERAKALEDEKLNKIIGIGQEGTVINIDEAKFDYLVIDEAHNFNKIFSSVKGEVGDNENSGRTKNQYKITGSQSSRAVKAFFVSNYIQKNSINGNICLLTATPFTNNPLEVFNILALTNVKRLSNLGVKSIVSFFDNYVNQSYEKVIKSTGEIEESAVIKGWNNKVSLQKILFTYMNYKSGADANIKRPEKWTLPKLSENVDGVVIPLPFDKQVTTYLKPTQDQKDIQVEISKWLLEQLKDSELMKKAPHLVADIMAKKNCISPYIYRNVNPYTIDPKDFISSSPKLKYTMECIRSVKEWHESNNSPVSCQVIYINGGVEYLQLVKRYLIEEIGYKTGIFQYGKNKSFDEVEILAGSGDFKRDDEEKEEIKALFNDGKIKIIIGTSTIREGIDLQRQSTVLYSLWVDWNPTDYKQLEGRIWRFGNEYSNVRIVSPLLVGSSDAFTYQKLEEKTARINDIFDRNDKTNILEVGEEDREAVKWALIDDLKEIAKSKIKDELVALDKQQKVLEENISDIKSVSTNISNLTWMYGRIKDFTDKYFKYCDPTKLPEDYELGNPLSELKAIKSQFEDIQKILESKGESTWDLRNNLSTNIWTAKDAKKKKKELDSIAEKIQQKFGLSIDDELDVAKESLEEEIKTFQEKKAVIRSEEYLSDLLETLEAEKKKFNSGIETFEETVEKFKSLNYLLGEIDEKEQLPVVEKSDLFKESIDDKKSIIEKQIRGLKLLVDMFEGNEKSTIEKQIRGLEMILPLL
jgi:superfamily II DNA or RNA helicase